MTSVAENPTAHEIATAIVAAARILRQEPLSVVTDEFATPARQLAFAALTEAFPFTDFRKIATWCGWAGTPKALGNLRAALAYNRRHKKWRWWRDADLAEVRAKVEAARDATEAAFVASINQEIIEPSDAPIVKAERVKKWRAGECDARTVDEPSIVIEATAQVEKTDAPVDVPRPPLIRRADPVVKRAPGPPVRSAPLVPNGVSHAASALAQFQRDRTKTRVPVVAVERRAVFDLSPGVSHMKPDPPIEKRPVVSLTADICGDPPPGRSALSHRRPAPPSVANDGPTSLEDFIRQGRH